VDEPERGRDETPEERADRNFTDILQELRVVLTGTQLISGFLLAVAFQSRFEDLDEQEVQHYLVLVVLAAVATLLGLTPVTLHRLHFAKRLKAQIVRRANGLLIATLAVVSVLVVGVTAFIFEVVVSPEAGLWAANGAAAAVLLLWIFALLSGRRAAPLDTPD
jgi:predicted small integral membrane protein